MRHDHTQSMPAPEGVRTIPLTRGKVAIVDLDDYVRLSQYNWCCDQDGYAMRRVHVGLRRQTTIRLQREVLNAPPGTIVDHINGDPLDNRKGNLRLCNRRQNRQNSIKRRPGASRFKGVSQDRGHWRARIRVHGKLIHLGHFVSEVDAAVAYDVAARHYFGTFCRTNFTEQGHDVA